MRDTLLRRILDVCLMGLLSLCSIGCGSMHYQLGNDHLFTDAISTVHVPMVRCDCTYRSGMSEQLTEAITKEIEKRTPYKVVGSPSDADTTLVVRLTSETKSPLVRTGDNQARQIASGMQVEVSIYDRGSAEPRQISHLPISYQTFNRNQILLPEAGQTMSTAQLRDMERVASDIVSVLETPW